MLFLIFACCSTFLNAVPHFCMLFLIFTCCSSFLHAVSAHAVPEPAVHGAHSAHAVPEPAKIYY